MLIGSGGRLGQECAHSQLNNHPLGFVGRGRISAQILWPGMGARLRKNDGTLAGPNAQTVSPNGTYTDGVVRKAILDRLRFGRRGARLEEARTNLCLQSEDLDTTWSTFACTVDANTDVAPDGAITADTLIDSNSSPFAHVHQTIALTDNLAYVFSVFVKEGTATTFSMIMRDTTAGIDRALIDFTWSGGVLSVGTQHTSTGEVLGVAPNGFTRIAIYIPANVVVGANTNSFRLMPTESNVQVAGTTIFSGMQVEQADFASSYIPTIAASVTRAADALRYGNAAESIAKAAQGTIFCAYTPGMDGGDVTTARIFSLGSTVDGVLLSTNTLGQFRYEVFSAGALTGTPAPNTTLVRGTTYVPAVTWKTAEFKLYIDGDLKSTDSSGAAPTAGAQWVHTDAMNLASLGSAGVATNSQDISHVTIFDRVSSAQETLQVRRLIRRWGGLLWSA